MAGVTIPAIICYSYIHNSTPQRYTTNKDSALAELPPSSEKPKVIKQSSIIKQKKQLQKIEVSSLNMVEESYNTNSNEGNEDWSPLLFTAAGLLIATIVHQFHKNNYNQPVGPNQSHTHSNDQKSFMKEIANAPLNPEIVRNLIQKYESGERDEAKKMFEIYTK